ncbi:P-loop containing nucleoside triphosphate hydrolase protein [Dendryphion nanum]|uniref:P-loop containing nucleoside triphosphate hydrolase protein n=1 Tax=Dendryphion nanum TaxID=256645 RepID=A0A9P9IX10_9PLEO|nr:P-loop containing nucleoside triphosphate hydrolase protein [Dendryphion nanum]
MCTVSDVECPLPAPFWIPLDPVDPDQQGQNLRRKLVLLGDTLCGKTRLTESWKTGEHHQMIDQYANTGSISETFIKTVYIEGVEVELVAWDNSGLDDRNYEMLRRLSYKDVHVIFICFDIGDEDAAVDNVQHMWNPEAAEYLRDVPKILVGCKSDLRDTRHPGELVSKAQACPCSSFLFRIPTNIPRA